LVVATGRRTRVVVAPPGRELVADSDGIRFVKVDSSVGRVTVGNEVVRTSEAEALVDVWIVVGTTNGPVCVESWIRVAWRAV
jgi:hypothetical protein